MLPILTFVFTLIAPALLTVISKPPHNSQTATVPMLRAYERAAKFGSESMGRLVYNASIEPHWLPDGDHFWYASHAPKGTQFILVDAAKGHQEPAFDAFKIARLLSKLTSKPVQPFHLPFSNFLYTPQRDAIAFEVDGKWLRVSLTDYSYQFIQPPKFRLPETSSPPHTIGSCLPTNLYPR